MEPGGLFESAGKLVGIIMPSWLSDPNMAIIAVIIMSTWQRIGYNMVFFLAGLQTIPQIFYEAAEVDGASNWVRFRLITIPLLQRTTLFIIVINTLANLKIFEQVFALSGGGPMHATMTSMIYIFNSAFRYTRFSYAAAMAIIFSLLTFITAIFQMYFLRSNVEY